MSECPCDLDKRVDPICCAEGMCAREPVEMEEIVPGKCSVPMFCMGMPDGYCDKPAYGERPQCKQFYSYVSQRMEREDGKYNGYVPGLACEHHGGPAKPTEK